MDAIDSDGVNVPVSVWIKPLLGANDDDVDAAGDATLRSIVVMEPVELSEGLLTFTRAVSCNRYSHNIERSKGSKER